MHGDSGGTTWAAPAVENHMPEVIIIDEIGTELEAAAARTIAQASPRLIPALSYQHHGVHGVDPPLGVSIERDFH